MTPTDALLAALQRLLDAEQRMTPGPWEGGRDEGGTGSNLWRPGGPLGEIYGDCAETEDTAQAIAALRNMARPLLEALIALQTERHLRLNVDDEPQFFDRLYALQEASDAALQRLAEALGVHP